MNKAKRWEEQSSKDSLEKVHTSVRDGRCPSLDVSSKVQDFAGGERRADLMFIARWAAN